MCGRPCARQSRCLRGIWCTSSTDLVNGLAAWCAVYGEAKHYGCCTVLNVVGGVWVGLVIMGSCALLMCILALKAIRAMDKLPDRG